MGNQREDDETLPPVINKVLCYTSTARHSMRQDDIIRICLSFYKEDEILKAKDYLYQLVGEKSIRRRNENRMVNEMQDLMGLLKKCDDKRMDLPKFVVDSYDKLPPSSGFEVVAHYMVSLIEEIASLRKEISILKENRISEIGNQQDAIIMKEDIITIKGEMRKLNHKLLGDDIRRNSLCLSSMDLSTKKKIKKRKNESMGNNSCREVDLEHELPVMSECRRDDAVSVMTPTAPPASQEAWGFMENEFQDAGGFPSAPPFADLEEDVETDDVIAEDVQLNMPQK